MLPFRGLFICCSVTFVHCAQTAEDIGTISFEYDSPCLSQIVLKFGLHRPAPTSLKILLQRDPPLVDLSVGDSRRQIAVE